MKLYIEEILKLSKVDDNILLENISYALDKLRSLFRRNYFKDNSEYKRIKQEHQDTKNSCEEYLTRSEKVIKPNLSFNPGSGKKFGINANIGIESNITIKDLYYKCRLEADKKYYSKLLDLLKRSKEKICSGLSDKDKCKKNIDSDIRDIERNLNSIRFVSQYLKK